jgi:hypothetical protein
MSNQLNSPATPGNDASLQFQAETDALLEKVSEQVDLEMMKNCSKISSNGSAIRAGLPDCGWQQL